MRKYMTSAIFAFVAISSPSHSQTPSIYEKCIAAIESGAEEEVNKLAEVMKFKGHLDKNDMAAGEKCLESAYNINFEYHLLFNRWISGDEADRYEIYSAKQEKRNSILRKRVCYGEKLKAIEKSILSVKAIIEGRNESLVAQITKDACMEINKKDRHAAVLDPVCRQVFLDGMHPDLTKDDLGDAYSSLVSEFTQAGQRLAELNAELDDLDGRSAEVVESESVLQKALASCE
jgi:hypothetical protein